MTRGSPASHRPIGAGWSLALSILVLLGGVAGACSSEPGTEPVSEEAFCDQARAFIDDRSISQVSSFSAPFFADVDARLEALAAGAPTALGSDFETLRAGFADSDQIFSQFDYDVSDPRLGPALEQVDNAGMLAATENIENYLSVTCGDSPSGAVDQAQVQDIIDVFGVDQTLAECLNRELGDIANIDSAQLTPDLLSRQVCGTSLIAVLAGGQP